MTGPDDKYVSRGGLKLDAALSAFGIDCGGFVCADFGSNVGGFTDCLLARGARRVYAVDTGYGTLAWKLRKDDRVVVMERTNALYAEVPETVDLVDLVAIDLAWTPQKLSVPAAAKWLKSGGKIISLLKPLFELAKMDPPRPARPGPRTLTDKQTEEIRYHVCDQLADLGYPPDRIITSPIEPKGGNTEFLLLVTGD